MTKLRRERAVVRSGKRWTRALRRVQLHVGYGWAWSCEFGTCHWAAPTEGRLRNEALPSPEAKPIKVAIVPINDWYRARAALTRKRK